MIQKVILPVFYFANYLLLLCLIDNQYMHSCHWKQKLLRWFLNTPYRSLDRAYEASKNLQSDSLFFVQLKSFSSTAKDLSRAQSAFGTTASSESRYVICRSLLEHRISLLLLGIQNYSTTFFKTKYISSSPIKPCGSYLHYTSNYSLFNSSMDYESDSRRRGVICVSNYEVGGKPTSAIRCSSHKLKNLQKMNRKLAWIESISNEFDSQVRIRSRQIFSFQISKKLIEKSLNCELANSRDSIAAYEPINLVPRSVTRTLSRFKAELTDQSNFLVYNDFDLSRNQASASLQYVGFSLFFPLLLREALKYWFLEPWIRGWWNNIQIQVFLNSLQEEKALTQLRETEALLWLDDVIGNFVDMQLQNFDMDARDKTTRLATTYNELTIDLLLQLATDTISIVIFLIFLLPGRKRLAVSNSWIQESFYSLNDTMKAFFILLLTDLCVGFHSPHGWEIIVGSFFEQFGLIPNKYVIPRFVSTFPVILDTVFKYWIFRHLNRTSPSIVATYHTMSE
uniref:Potassium/proton antiporter CemA n=1 Tax=Pityrogramma trifoliata TaxID=164275 RepID=A0A3G5CQV7_9MONI|nr:chloroplast envelope membrane protein [Pityrogramma trifoliata]AYW15238.1 chloroplast envelope membrane protein [Pityrogramma trifoliata]